VGAGFVSQR
jgi:hypothetical protein